MKNEGGIDSSNGIYKKKRYSQGLPVFNSFAGGIDIGDYHI